MLQENALGMSCLTEPKIPFDLSLTPEVLQRFKQNSEDLDSMANPPKTWVELSVLYVVGRRPS